MNQNGGFVMALALFLSLMIGATEPMMNNDLKERTAATVRAEYSQALRTLACMEQPHRHSVTVEDRDRFALNCAHRLQGMAKLAISCGAAEEARQALDAAKALRIAVYGGDGWEPEKAHGVCITWDAKTGETIRRERVTADDLEFREADGIRIAVLKPREQRV